MHPRRERCDPTRAESAARYRILKAAARSMSGGRKPRSAMYWPSGIVGEGACVCADALRLPAHSTYGSFANGAVCQQLSRAAAKRQERKPAHSMTSSARARRERGISRPRALVVFALTINLNRVGCSNGRSCGFDPLRTRSTRAATRSQISSSSGP